MDHGIGCIIYQKHLGGSRNYRYSQFHGTVYKALAVLLFEDLCICCNADHDRIYKLPLLLAHGDASLGYGNLHGSRSRGAALVF